MSPFSLIKIMKNALVLPHTKQQNYTTFHPHAGSGGPPEGLPYTVASLEESTAHPLCTGGFPGGWARVNQACLAYSSHILLVQ